MFLNNIDQITSIEWGKTHYWDVLFTSGIPYNTLESPPSPFNTWFPATEVEENLATLTPQPIETYLSSTSVPLRTTEQNISLTFFDDDNHTLSQWLTNWVNNEILSGGHSIAPIKDIVRMLVVVKYKIVNGLKIPLGSISQSAILNPLDASLYGINAYYVFPDLTFNFNGNSDAGVPSYTVNFLVAGKSNLSAIPDIGTLLKEQLAKPSGTNPTRSV